MGATNMPTGDEGLTGDAEKDKRIRNIRKVRKDTFNWVEYNTIWPSQGIYSLLNTLFQKLQQIEKIKEQQAQGKPVEKNQVTVIFSL